MNITWPANRFVPLSKLLAAFCVLLIPWTPLHRAEGSDQAECDPPGNVGLDFVVTAPQKKPNGESWDKGQLWDQKRNPDIFVCLRAAPQQWNCAPPCEDSIVCEGTLRVVPSCGELEIAVFDNDDQEEQNPEVIFEPEKIIDALGCHKNKPCEVWDGEAEFTLLEPRIDCHGNCKNAQFSVIWLHGLGGNGDEWVDKDKRSRDR